MLNNFLPADVYDALVKKCSIDEITEIHIRKNKPICVVCNTKTYFLSSAGICSNLSLAIFASEQMIEQIVFKASNYSLYAKNEQLKKGYIMVDGGIRIGVCGEVVFDGEVKTIKNITSLCIRIPHFIKNVSLKIFKHVLNNETINNTLIISPPGAGKTTMLRDLIYQFSAHNYPFNVFVADERGEITGGETINLGNFCDSVCFLNKKDAFMLGIRSMSPNIIATDELGDQNDLFAAEYAINSGIALLATIHAAGVEDLKNKEAFLPFIVNKYFKRYIVLSKSAGVGTIEGVYNENLQRIYGATVWNLCYALALLPFWDMLVIVYLGFTFKEKSFFNRY